MRAEVVGAPYLREEPESAIYVNGDAIRRHG